MKWSDVDILVVMPAYNQISKAVRITNSLQAPFSLDLIVRTPERLQPTGRMETGFCVRFWPRGRSFMRRLTAGWVRKAEADMVGARILDQSKPLLNDLICFHCQQAAEKYLKALLQEWLIVPPRTHELVVLLDLLLPRDPKLRSLRRKLNSLNRYAVQVRYPDKNPRRRESRTALRHAESVRIEIRTRLGLRR